MATVQPQGALPDVTAGSKAGRLPALAGALSLSSAIAHFGVTSPHWAEWWAHGAFFLVCGGLQAVFAALILGRQSTWVLLSGVAGNLAVVGLYVYSRTNGPPVGPHRGVPEAPGYYDMITLAGELALVFVLLAMLRGRPRRQAMNLVALVALALWAGKATGVLV